MAMLTNQLRSQAALFLARALEAQECGRSLDAHELTVKAVECLEDAMSLERLRGASTRATTRLVVVQSSR
jgi:hypothetical protein